MAVACTQPEKMGNWYCIYTKPKMEDYVSTRLMNVPDVEVINPKIRTRRFLRGKLKNVTEELFPCYIFSRFKPLHHHHLIKYTRGVKQILGDSSGRPYIVGQDIIDNIQDRIRDGFIDIQPAVLNEGDNVVIQEGPFRGFTGIFQKELKASERVMILLNTLAYQANIEIEKGCVAKV
jgi:transcriptional antiterminator RfaH